MYICVASVLTMELYYHVTGINVEPEYFISQCKPCNNRCIVKVKPA